MLTSRHMLIHPVLLACFPTCVLHDIGVRRAHPSDTHRHRSDPQTESTTLMRYLCLTYQPLVMNRMFVSFNHC